MKKSRLDGAPGFRVLTGNARSQAAVMVVSPGATEGGEDNRHGGADQWLFVTSGTGEAIIDGVTAPLNAGTVLLIERGEPHEIRNTGESALVTLNIYVPPAYSETGDELEAAKPEASNRL